jgi:hypothetical protein
MILILRCEAPFGSPRPHPEVRAKRASKERTRVAQDDGRASKDETHAYALTLIFFGS